MGPDDRLGDLGAGRGREPDDPLDRDDPRSAAERLAELDITQPEEEQGPAGPPARPSGIYNWVIGVAFLAVVVIAALSTLPDAGSGLRGPAEGETIPDFAAPSALGGSDEPINLKRAGDDLPNKTPACDVNTPDAVNICALRRDKPLVLTFIAREGDCEPALDVVEAVRPEFPQVQFVGVVSGDSRSDVAELVREHGWDFPVAVDEDGLLINVYGIGVCPTTTFAYKGGEVMKNNIGNLGRDKLRDQVRLLLRGKPSPPS